MCIYEFAYNNLKNRKVFWQYMINIHDECGNVFNEACSKTAHEVIQELSWDDTELCVLKSFSTQDKTQWSKSTTTNKLIDQDIDYWNKYGSSIVPSIVINNSTYRGQLEP